MPQAIRILARSSVPRMSIMELQGKVVIPDDVVATLREQRQHQEVQQQLSKLVEDSHHSHTHRTSYTSDAAGPHTKDSDIDAVGAVVATTMRAGESGVPIVMATDDDNLAAPPAVNVKDTQTAHLHFIHTSSSPSSSSSLAAADDAMEVPMGDVVSDPHDAQRCTLRMGTLHVHGKRRKHTRPLLIIQRVAEHTRRELYDTPQASACSSAQCAKPVTGVACEEASSQDYSAAVTTELFDDWLARNRHVLALDRVMCTNDAPLTRQSPAVLTTQLTEDAQEAAPAKPPLSYKRVRDEGCDVLQEGSEEVRFVDYELIGYVDEQMSFDAKPSRVMK